MFSTEGRRQPTLIGKDVSGHRIPGGPYTSWQLIAAVVVAVGMWLFQGVWAVGSSPVVVVLTCAVFAALAGFLAGYIDPSRRNIGLQLTAWVPAFYRAVRPDGAAIPRGVPRRRPDRAPGLHTIALPEETVEQPEQYPPAVEDRPLVEPVGEPVLVEPALVKPVGEPASVEVAAAAPGQEPDEAPPDQAAPPTLTAHPTPSRLSPLETFLGAGERISTR